MVACVCEVCGGPGASAVLLRCAGHLGCQGVCHTYCLPATEPRTRKRGRPSRSSTATAPANFTCQTCSTTSGSGSGSVQAGSAAQEDASNWPQLPTEVLASILQHMPLAHRLASCALVSTAWAAAAAAVPVTEVSIARPTALQLRRAWQEQALRFRSQLTSLRVELTQRQMGADSCPVLQLPCAELRALELHSLAAQLADDVAPSTRAHASTPSAPPAGAAGPSPGARASTAQQHYNLLHCLPGLTRLCAQEVRLLGLPHWHLTGLGALTHLQHLHCEVWVAEDSFEPLVTGTVLQQLASLTHLHMRVSAFGTHSGRGPRRASPALSACAAQQLGRLSRLVHLCVLNDRNEEQQLLRGHTSGLVQLTRLTHLALGPAANSALPPLAPLIQLQRLSLHGCSGLDLAAMTGLSGLQTVELQDCWFWGQDSTTAALLAWLQQQEQLRYLTLRGWPSGPQAPAAAYAAVTASSSLCSLRLGFGQVPLGAGDHMFPEGLQLQHLTSLEVNHPAESGEQQARMLRACPSLQQLTLSLPFDPHHSSRLAAAQVRHLTRLTRLELSRACGSDVPALLQLPQLQDLNFRWCSLNAAAVEQLTALKQLTRLRVKSVMLSPPFSNHVHTVEFAGGCNTEEPVWLQLLQRSKQVRRVAEERQRQQLEWEQGPYRNRLRSRNSAAGR